MKFSERVKQYLKERKDPERSEGGYKALATRLSRDLGKDISSSQVKRYLKKNEKTFKDIKKRAKESGREGAYKYAPTGAIYKILRGHFSK